MGCDAWDTKAGADFVADPVREGDRLIPRHDRELRGRAERPVGLRPVDPDALTDPAGVHTLADRIDDTGAVAVRDDARIRQPGADPVAALLRIARIDAGDREAYPNLARPGLGIGHHADLQHLRAGPARSYHAAS